MKHLLLTTIAAVVLVATTAFAGPIHTAAEKGDPAGVQAELDKGVDVDESDDSWPEMTPLHYAVGEGHTEVVELLIANGANVNAKDEEGWTPLHLTAYWGGKEITELLIAKGADVNAKNNWIGTPLDIATHPENPIDTGETADLIRKHGGKTSEELKDLEEVKESIHAAARVGHIEAVKQHLAAGADVNAKGNIGETPLDWAIRGKHTEIADLLRKHGGKSGAEDSIQVAASVGNIEAVKQHLAAGADVNAKDDKFGITPLHLAVDGGHTEIVKLLIAKGADVKVADMSLMTPLHFAVVFGHKEIVELLIVNGADMNAKDANVGWTPLHYAAFNGHKEIAELLIAKGADVNAKDEHGETPLDYANGVVANLLRKYGGKTGAELKALMPRLTYDRGLLGFAFNTIEGKTYRVESGMDLIKWNSLGDIIGTGGEVTFIDVRRIYFPYHFYRVKVVE